MLLHLYPIPHSMNPSLFFLFPSLVFSVFFKSPHRLSTFSRFLSIFSFPLFFVLIKCSSLFKNKMASAFCFGVLGLKNILFWRSTVTEKKCPCREENVHDSRHRSNYFPWLDDKKLCDVKFEFVVGKCVDKISEVNFNVSDEDVYGDDDHGDATIKINCSRKVFLSLIAFLASFHKKNRYSYMNFSCRLNRKHTSIRS